jgi:hypothetical protein
MARCARCVTFANCRGLPVLIHIRYEIRLHYSKCNDVCLFKICFLLLPSGNLCYMTVMIQVEVFWVVTPCSTVVGYQYFRGPCCLHLQGEVHGAGSRRGRGTCESIGKWVKPACEGTTGRERKEV